MIERAGLAPFLFLSRARETVWVSRLWDCQRGLIAPRALSGDAGSSASLRHVVSRMLAKRDCLVAGGEAGCLALKQDCWLLMMSRKVDEGEVGAGVVHPGNDRGTPLA